MNTFINPTTLRTAAHVAGRELQHHYEQSDAIEKSILHHSAVQGAIVLIPVPLVGEIACIVNQLHMYHQINKYLGVKFSKNVMKVLGKFLLSQVSGLVALFAGLAVF